IIDEDVGPGLPLWLPRGAAIIEELEKLAKETEFAAGYQRVRTLNIAREALYLKSGHLPYYRESMFPPMELHAEGDVQQQIEVSARSISQADKFLRESLDVVFPGLKKGELTNEEFIGALKNLPDAQRR